MSQAISMPVKNFEQDADMSSEPLVQVVAPVPITVRKSLQVDDVSFASSSDLSYTIKNLDMSSILKHRRGHQVSF